MKKFMKPFVLVAAAAMALVSCQKNEIDAPQKQTVHFTINAGIHTKTVISDNGDGTYTPSWKNGDEIGIFFTEPTEKVEKVDATFSNKNESGAVARFEGDASVESDGTFYAFYPKSAFNQHYGDGTIRLDLPAVQKPTSTSFDPACDILVAKPCDYIAEAGVVVIDDMYFARLMSVLRVNLKGEFAQGEIVKSLTLKVQDPEGKGIDVTGNAKVDYKAATITAWNNGNVDRNEVTATYSDEEYITIADGNNAAYLVIAPVTIPAGSTLTFTLKTDNYNISKTVTAPEDMSFTEGNISVMNLTIKEENCEAIVAETRIWVEGFDNEATNKTQTSASNSGVAGTGVSNELTYAYSEANCNVRINSNGQTATNPFLYINAANASFTASNIKIADEGNLALSAMVKGNGLKLTVEYKESDSSNWSSAGTINGTSAFAQGEVIFAVPTSATSLDIRLTGNGVMYVDDIVLESTDEDVPVVTLTSISISNQTTEYQVGDSFVKPTVTATYSDDSTADVTESATFSECDMNTPGDKTVIVTYEGKTVDYKFTVKEKGTSTETIEWVATSFADLKAGDQVVIVGTKSSATYAMSNDKGASSAPIPVTVTVSGNKLTTTPEDKIIWSVGVDGSYRIFNATATTWLYCTSNNNGVRVGTNAAKTFTLDKGYLKHVGTGRYLGIYNTQDWRCYTSHTTTNIANQTFQFFVKSGNAGGETPEPGEPETPVEPTLTPRNLAFSATTATATVGQAFTSPTLNGEKSGVTYTSSNTNVATIDSSTGTVTLVGEGSTTITASAPATEQYEAGTASYTLTVSAAQPDQPGGDEGDTGGTHYVKVTTATPGSGTYLYVLDKGYVFTGDVSDNSWGKSAAVTIEDSKIVASDAVNAYAIILEEGSTSGQYAVKLPNGQYLQTSTSKPSSKATPTYMTYDITEGLRSVENNEYYFHGNGSSQNKFRWYKLSSNQLAGQLYKLN